ncbi:MAG: DUF4405 domain-containing protein [Bacteroidales bacterium]|nr:DUF4405 domain-containing protein [Bacteroidales bacterium]
MKKIFVVDWTLLFCFLLTAGSGVGMHIAGHGSSHLEWEVWAWAHSLLGLLFAVFVVWHVKMHIGWYKSLFKKGKSGKNKHITTILTAIAIAITITGIVMFAVSGANSGIGMWHYRIGILFSLFALGHIIKRIPILRKIR